jgi:hypothetical protein
MIRYLLASSLDNCVDSCLSLASVEGWDLDVVPPENFSRRRRRSYDK